MRPKGKWKECSLGEVLLKCHGGAWGEASESPNAGVIRTTNINKIHKLDLTNVAWRSLPQKQVEKQLLITGDVIMSKSNSIERVGACGFFVQPETDGRNYVAANFCQRLRFDDSRVFPEFGYYWIVSSGIQESLKSQATGTSSSLQNINGKKIAATPIAFPKVDEQRRIVARIKECMERVEEIEELQYSITSEYSIMPSASKYDLWNECSRLFDPAPLNEAVLSAKNGLYKPKKFHGSGTVLLRMFNIKDGELILDRIERLQTTKKESVDFAVMNGNIIVSRVNSRELVGKSAFVQGLDESAVNEAMIIRLQIDDNKANGRFLAWLMNSPQFLNDLRGRAKHAIGQSSINQSDLLSSKVPLPGIEEQQAIVDAKTQLLPLAFHLHAEAAEKSRLIPGLRDSILRKAFAGEL